VILCAAVLFVVVGFLVGRFLVVWGLLAMCASIAGLVLLAGDSGPEWPDFPLPEHPRSRGSEERPAVPGHPWNGARTPVPSERHTPAR